VGLLHVDDFELEYSDSNDPETDWFWLRIGEGSISLGQVSN